MDLENAPGEENRSNNEQENSGNKFVYQGLTKKIESAEELAEYTKNIEAQLAAQHLETQRRTSEEAEKSTGSYFNGDGSSEITPEDAEKMFHDPVGFAKKMRDDMRKELDERDARKVHHDKFWKDFYKVHPELKEKEKVVDLVLKSNWQEIQSAPLSKAKEIIAKESFKLIAEIKGNSDSRKEVLPSNGGPGLPSSSGHVATRESTPVITNFIDEMKSLKAKRSLRK